MSASILAGELGLPLFQVRLDGLITKFMGETAAKLRQIFEATNQTKGVYFLMSSTPLDHNAEFQMMLARYVGY